MLVTCSPQDHASPSEKTSPTLIVEVLSPSTAAHDRSGKFSHCRQLDSRSTDCFRKQADGLWVLHPFADCASVTLTSVALEMTPAQLFVEI